jgi:hypothetical protein
MSTLIFSQIDISSLIANRMSEEEIIEKAGSMSGQICTVLQLRPAKLRAAFRGVDLVKFSRYQMRIGLEYENREIVKQIREDGKEASPLRGKHFVQYPYLLEGDKSGKKLLAGAPLSNPVGYSQWLLNGEFVEPSQIQHCLLSQELTKNDSLWLTPSVSNILSIK